MWDHSILGHIHISNTTFLTGKNPTSSKGTWTRAFMLQSHLISLISIASLALIRRRMPTVVHHPRSRSQSCFAAHFDRWGGCPAFGACALASEQPNHNPQPAYKIPAANAGRMISTRKSVFSVNSSDARQNGSEEVQKPYYNQSVIRNYMESSRPL